MRLSTALKTFAIGLLVTAISLGPVLPAKAAVQSPTATAKVSFTFDDGLTSASTIAAPTLAKYGLTGTDYVITGCVGMTVAPNTCRADTTRPYMTWAQIQALQSSGWEIGSHTVDHDCLASNAKADPDDCQTATLTTTQLQAEFANSKATLAANGINATDIAVPYGDYNNNVIAQLAKYYASMRGFKDVNNNVWPYNDYLLNNLPIQEKVNTVASVKAKIDAAITAKTYLALTFHDIADKPSQVADDYQYGTAELDQIAAYVKTKQDAGQLKAVNVNQALVTSDTNMLSNGSFNSGITGGWTTDNATGVTWDKLTNGSYPDPTNSIKFVAGTANEHLFSPKVAVNPATTYISKNFLNVQALKSGEFAFYVDEYDANGNWISGQYKSAEKSSFVESINFTYKPTSTKVAQASLQYIVTGGSGITAYLDNAQLFASDGSTTTPPVDPPTQTNLVAGGTFESGIGSGWTTDDSANIVADTAGNGSAANPTGSVKMTSTTKNTHLFSPKVAITSGKTYSLSSYLNLKSTTDEVGYYIDEYDASGNWISGQYKTGVRTVGTNTVNIAYTPTSASVAKSSLQVILVANTGTVAYLDNVLWYQN